MISAVIHTYNEEKNIERCLSSLSWCDERVLIDMDSTDKTCLLAQKYQTKIFTHPYTGFVEPARNFGIEKAEGDWILIIDADETVSFSLSSFLQKESLKPRADFYRIPRKNIIFGKWIKHAGWWPDYQIRFFKKGTVSWVKDLHGIPITQGRGFDLKAVESLSILHYHYQTLEQFLERLNRYTSIAAKELHFSNKKFTLKNFLEEPNREFIRRYFIWEGYKEGIHGLALSFLQSFSALVTYLKLWELEGFSEKKILLKDVLSLLKKEEKQRDYWLAEIFQKSSSNFLQKLFWRLKKKVLCRL